MALLQKEIMARGKADGDVIGPAAHHSTCGDGAEARENGPCQLKIACLKVRMAAILSAKERGWEVWRGDEGCDIVRNVLREKEAPEEGNLEALLMKH
jgi:hypothetical protein